MTGIYMNPTIGWIDRSTADGDTLSYSDFVKALAKPLPRNDHLNHMVMGVAGEAGELVDCIKKHTIYEKPLDRGNLIEEIGDTLFYLQGIMNAERIDFQEVLQHNYEKLKKRYESLSYSNEAAVARADKGLEQNQGEQQ